MRRGQLLNQFKHFNLTLVWAVVLIVLSACSEKGELEYFNGGPQRSTSSLQGKALMFEAGSQAISSFSQTILTSCADKKVTLHKVKTDGTIDVTVVGESEVDDDGNFKIPGANAFAIAEGGVINYVLKAKGCEQEFIRPVTDFSEQDISMGTTFLGFIHYVDNSSKTNLNSMTIADAKNLIASLSEVNGLDLNASFNTIVSDASKKQAFEALTGISLSQLKNIPPQSVTTTLPSVIKEGQSHILTAEAIHWYSGYQKAYKWKVDGNDLASTGQFTWSLDKNSQGAHSIVLTIGQDNGSGAIDLTKPVFQKTITLIAENTYPAVAPIISAPQYVNTSSVAVSITTGAAFVNCETFSSMALVEGFLPPQSPSEYTKTCATVGTQTESFALSPSVSTKYISLWTKDAQGNISETSHGTFVTIDQTAPTVSISDITGTKSAGSSLNVNWDGADSSGLSELNLQYAADGTTFVDVVNLLTNGASPYVWTVPFDQITTAKFKITATDNAGNSNSALTSSFAIDASLPGPPSATLSGAPTITNGSSFTVAIAMSEAVTGLASSDFVVTNGAASNLVQINQGSYTVDITPSIASGSSGTVTVKIPAGTFQDVTANVSVADSNTLSTTVDKLSPSVTLSSVSTSPTNGSIAVTATFSESVTGFAVGDVTASNATVGAFAGSGTTYTFIVTPTIANGASGTVAISVGSALVQDAATNDNVASNALSFTIDNIVPTVTLTSATANPTNGTMAVTATFSESVTGFVVGDVTATNATVGAFAGSGTTYTFVVTPTIASGGSGTVAISVAGGVALDTASNPNTASNSLSYSIDKIGPTVNLTSSTANPTNGAIAVTATFSESVTGFIVGDVTATNATVGTFTGSGTTYTFVVTPTIASGATGTVVISVAANVAQDAATNDNTVSNSLSYSIDKVIPTLALTSTDPDPTNGNVTVTAIFSESVTGFDSSDLTVGNAIVTSFSGSGTTYSFLMAPISNNSVTVLVAAGSAQDAAGNTNSVSNTLSRTYDAIQPTVTLTSATTSPTNGAISVTATFSEIVTGFDATDVTVTNANVGAVAGSGTTYTFTVTPTTAAGATGTVTIAVPINKAIDAATNQNLASNTLTYSIDKVVPTVVLMSAATDPTNGTILVTATFSESVTGFTSSGVTATSANVSAVSGSGTTYAFNVAPTTAAGGTGTVTIQVAASAGQDSAGNDSTASNTLTYSIDKVVPTVALTSASSDPASSNVTVAVTFSKSVTGFDSTDFTLSNGTVSSVSGSGTTYSVVIAPTVAAQSTGTLSVQVDASSATDAAGNANSASNTLTRSIDMRGPTVTLSSAAATTVTGSFSVTATLSLASSDFTSGDVAVTGGTVANFSAGSSTSYTFDVVPAAQQASPGAISISVAAGTLTGSALGNANTVSNTLTRTATTLTQSWGTNLTSSDATVFPVTTGVASLSSTNLTQTDFTAGTHVGTVGTTAKLTLNPTLPSPRELDSSWAPKWSNVIGYWKLDGTGAISNGAAITATVGSSGSAVNGSGAMTYQAAKVATGATLDGASDYIQVPDSGTEFEPANITVMAWVNLSAYPASAGTGAVVTKPRGTPGTNGACYRLSIYDVTGRPQIYARSTALGTVTATATNGISLSSWHHLAMTADGTNLNLYVDGSLSKTIAFAASLECLTSTGALSFGAYDNGGFISFLNGKIDDVTILNTPLTASEIQYVYQKQNPSATQSELDSTWTPQWNSLVGHWKMNNDWNDSTGNGNNLTAFGNATFATAKLGSYSAAFDGTGDYATKTAPTNLDMTTYTVSAWINSGAKSDFNAIAAKSISTSNRTFWLGLDSTTGALSLKASSGGVAHVCSVIGTTDLRSKGWVYVTGVHSTSSCSVYVNGVLEGIDSTAGTPEGVGASLYVGRDTGATARDFNGSIDELAIWNTSLTGDEILKIYNRQNTKFGGLYTSSITATPVSSSWTNFKWLSSLPFYKEFPGDTNADATPDSESSAEYSGVSASSGQNLELLWHLNESSWVNPNYDAIDSSGKNRPGVSGTGTISSAVGKLKGAANLNVANNRIQSAGFDLGAIGTMSTFAWVKLHVNPPFAGNVGLTSKFVTSGSAFDFYLVSTGALRVSLSNGGTSHIALTTTTTFSDWDQWHHVGFTYDGANVKIWRDGALIATSGSETGVLNSGSGGFRVGCTSSCTGTYLNGLLDEVGLWSRALAPSEVLEFYRRGANRNKFQFRSCAQSNCSDKTDADWVGPDKTPSTWFSELHNMVSVASTGDGSGVVNLTAPLLDFSKWIAAVSGWTFAPTPAKYFQYRALMESDDVNNLCLDGSSNAITCMPDITSVTPTAELSPAPYITSVTGTSFYTTISSLSFTISGACASDANYPVKYQLSKDGGSTYQYYNGSAWVAATAGTYSTASTQAQITAGLSTFTCSSAPCTLMARSYPGTNAANSCSISAPVVSINRF